MSTFPRSCGKDAPARLGDTPVVVWWSGRDAGDQRALGTSLAPPAPVPEGLALHRLRQVHGPAVAVVGGPDGAVDGPGAPDAAEPFPEADALVSRDPGVVLCVLTADCAPVALAAPTGAFGAVHVGWRGLMAGVVPGAVGAMDALGARGMVAGLGPCIGPCCYEFSPADLDAVAGRFGDEVRAESGRGRPALDLRAALRAALAQHAVPVAVDASVCTACTEGFFSHRARGDEARQAVFVWRDDTGR